MVRHKAVLGALAVESDLASGAPRGGVFAADATVAVSLVGKGLSVVRGVGNRLRREPQSIRRLTG